MMVRQRAYWVFLASLLLLTFSAAQLWQLLLALRQGDASGAQMVIGGLSTPILIVSAIVVLRILYVTTRTRGQL